VQESSGIFLSRQSSSLIASRPHQRKWQVKFHEVLGVHNDIDMPSIARATLAIRKAIQAVDDDYVKHRMAIPFAEAAKIPTAKAYPNAVDAATTGVDFSSWKDWLESDFDPRGKMTFQYPPSLDGKMRFDIPGVKTDFPDFFRTSNGQHEGSCILLPRRTGGPAGEHAPWEISLRLREEEMTHLRFVSELGGWVQRVLNQKVKEIVRQNGGVRDAGGAQVVRPVRGEEYNSRCVRDDDADGYHPAKRQKLSEPAVEPDNLGEPLDLTED
jgi:hypothetical protein